jgi:hypothetical protein
MGKLQSVDQFLGYPPSRTRHLIGNLEAEALYHLASPGVVESPEWKEASASTPMPQRVRDQISNRLRLVCRNYVRA